MIAATIIRAAGVGPFVVGIVIGLAIGLALETARLSRRDTPPSSSTRSGRKAA